MAADQRRDHAGRRNERYLMKLDTLYTLRWFAKEMQKADSIERCRQLGSELEETLTEQIDKNIAGGDRETPAPGEKMKPLLVLVVGHTMKSPGAAFALGENEYQYNKKVADLCEKYISDYEIDVKIEVVLRDRIGLSGAYEKVKSLRPDACIELHFNAFNKRVTGTETLCSANSEDRKFTEIVHKNICKVFERDGLSRGIKVIPRSGRGGFSVNALEGIPNCLVEPFFGDVESEAKMGQEKQGTYARSIVDSVCLYFKEKNLITTKEG